MDVIAEYAERYGTPDPKTSWHQIIALVKRAGRFELRERIIYADGVQWGRPEATADATGMLLRAKYEDLAWPGAK